jgi:hypothetical protein
LNPIRAESEVAAHLPTKSGMSGRSIEGARIFALAIRQIRVLKRRRRPSRWCRPCKYRPLHDTTPLAPCRRVLSFPPFFLLGRQGNLVFHTECLSPPLAAHPSEEERWACPSCAADSRAPAMGATHVQVPSRHAWFKSVRLFVCPSVRLSVCLSVRPSDCLTLSVRPSDCLRPDVHGLSVGVVGASLHC